MGITVYDGYASGYTRKKVLNCAKAVAATIKQLKKDTGITPTIVVHGNSGVSVGFAALVMEDFNLVLLRKDNDNSHGSPIEGPNGHHVTDYYILDDFVSSGDTMRRIVNKMNALADAKGHSRPTPKAMILYHGGRSKATIDREKEIYLDTLPLVEVPEVD